MKVEKSTGDSSRLDLVFFSNGPGEISTWVKPVLRKFMKNDSLVEMYRPILVIHPCQFASGKEVEVGRKLDGIELVIGARDYLKIIFFGKRYVRRRGWSFSGEGVIISLGGDLMHPVLFKKRIGGRYRLFAYTNNGGWEKNYEKIFVRNDYVKQKLLSRGVDNEKIVVTGDLVYSSIEKRRNRKSARAALGVSDEEICCAILPGSRDFEVRYMLPVFMRAIEKVIKEIHGLRPFILKSPFATEEILKEAVENGGNIREAEATGGEIVEFDKLVAFSRIIRTSGGVDIPLLEGGLDEWGEAFDFAITVPGTNTIQLAYRGIPALVITPLNKPELIPVEGLFGLLKWIPIFGKPVLRKIALKYAEKFPFSSLPNMYMGYEILPELFGVIKTEDIIDKVKSIIKEKTYLEIKEKLSVFSFSEDPADRIVSFIFSENR